MDATKAREEVERAVGAFKHGHVSFGYVMQKVDALLAADAEDAARYRWLKDRHPDAIAAVAWGASSSACAFPATELDAAVDQARKAWPGFFAPKL